MALAVEGRLESQAFVVGIADRAGTKPKPAVTFAAQRRSGGGAQEGSAVLYLTFGIQVCNTILTAMPKVCE